VVKIVIEKSVRFVAKGLLLSRHILENRILLIGLPVRNDLTKEIGLIEHFLCLKGHSRVSVLALLNRLFKSSINQLFIRILLEYLLLFGVHSYAGPSRVNSRLFLVKVSLKDGLMPLFDRSVPLLNAFELALVMGKAESTILNLLHGLFFLLELGLDLGWDNFRDWHGKDSGVDCLKHDDPEVSSGSVGYLPLLSLNIPSMPSPDRGRHLIDCEWGVHEVWNDNHTVLSCLNIHLLYLFMRERQSVTL
jgi:hypothetical protein